MHPKLDQAKKNVTSFLEKMLAGWIIPSEEDYSPSQTPPISEETAHLNINADGTLDRATSYDEGEIFLELTLNSGSYQGIPVELEPVSILGSFAQFTDEERTDVAALFDTWAQQLTTLKILENKEGTIVLQNAADSEQWICFPRVR